MDIVKGFEKGENWRRKRKTEGPKRELTRLTYEHRRQLSGFPDVKKRDFGFGFAVFGELQQEVC